MHTTATTYAYADDAYSTVRITGSRIPAAHTALMEWALTSDCLIPVSAMSAYMVSLAHAFFEADALCEWTFFVAALTPQDRATARRMGLLV